MARLEVLAVAVAWLLVIAAVVRSRVRLRPHQHWLDGLETLRALSDNVSAGR